MRKMISRHQIPEKLRDHGLAALFEIKIPEIAIEERDHDPVLKKVRAAPA